MLTFVVRRLLLAIPVLLAFPYLLLAIAVVAALGAAVLNTTLVVGIWGTPTVTRIVRGAVRTARETEYVRAACALGASSPATVVYATLFMANAILVEAALSFLGLGVQPPTSSWGLMVSTGRDFLLMAPYIATIPGLAVMVTALGFNLLGDGLLDAPDPRLRGQS